MMMKMKKIVKREMRMVMTMMMRMILIKTIMKEEVVVHLQRELPRELHFLNLLEFLVQVLFLLDRLMRIH